MKDNKEIMCDQCKNQVPMSDAKYASKGPNSVMVLCADCRDRTSSKKNKEKIKGIIKEVNTLIKPKQNLMKKSISDKIKYFCSRCRYKFSHDDLSENNLRCPYCSKSDYIAEYKTFSADNIVKSAAY